MKYLQWHIQEATINSGIAICLFIILILYPVLMQVFLHAKKNHLRTKTFRAKYEQAYSGLEEADGKYLIYPTFFFFRRVLVTLSIIVYPNYIIVHYFTLTMTGIATVILIGLKHPFK